MPQTQFDSRYLLLLPCGGRKSTAPGGMEAWDRYDGPMYRDLRCWRDAGCVLPAILILSAGYGLIEPRARIPDYDVEMDDDLCTALAEDDSNWSLFRRHFERAESVVSVAGRKYDAVFRQWLEPGEGYAWDDRGIGYKRQTMRQFLESVPQPQPQVACAA